MTSASETNNKFMDGRAARRRAAWNRIPRRRRKTADAFERVKKRFLTRFPTRPASLGSRWKRLRLAAAHSLTLARLRAERYFCRRTCRRQKCFELYLRLRAQTLRGFFDSLKNAFSVLSENAFFLNSVVLFPVVGRRLRHAEHTEALAVDLVGFENDGE